MNQTKLTLTEPLSMQEMYLKYPPGTTIENLEVTGYSQTKNQSALFLSEPADSPKQIG